MKNVVSRCLILGAAFLWGCIGIFYNQLISLGLSSVEVVFLRTLSAAFFIGIFLIIRDRSLFIIHPKDSWMFVGTGIVSLAFFNLCYFRAIDLLDMSTASVLLYTAPIFVMILSAILFRESMSFKKWVVILATVIGCVLVSGGISSPSFSPIGLLFGIGSGIGYALYSIFGVIALRRYRTETITFYTMLFACISVIPLCRFSVMSETVINAPIVSIGNTIGIGFIACMLPFLLYTTGLQHTPPGEASIMATLEPVVATAIGIIWFDNEFTFVKATGMIAILGSIILLHIPKNKKRKE